jgi:hypothetical protein
MQEKNTHFEMAPYLFTASALMSCDHPAWYHVAISQGAIQNSAAENLFACGLLHN